MKIQGITPFLWILCLIGGLLDPETLSSLLVPCTLHSSLVIRVLKPVYTQCAPNAISPHSAQPEDACIPWPEVVAMEMSPSGWGSSHKHLDSGWCMELTSQL